MTSKEQLQGATKARREGRTWFPELRHNKNMQNAHFSKKKKKKRYAKKQEDITQYRKKKQSKETISEEAQILDLLDKNFE